MDASAAGPLLTEIDTRGVARLTLNRPAVLNAFDEELIAALAAAFTRVDADPAVRIVVLGATGRVFCAGADIGWMQRAAANDEAANLEDARRFAGMLDAMSRCRKPVVACVQGAAYGGGVGLTCAADVAIASERAKFCVSEARFGILPAVIGPYLVNAVGVRQARRLALTMTVVGAAEAQALGMVHKVVAEEQLCSAVAATVEELLQGGPGALAEIKALMGQLEEGPITAEVRELTAQTISRVRATGEAREGFAAFVDKRPAAWNNS
jgi:methylglutaconyl-CoA hydratase